MSCNSKMVYCILLIFSNWHLYSICSERFQIGLEIPTFKRGQKMAYFESLPSCFRNMCQKCLFWSILDPFMEYVLKLLILSSVYWTFQTPTRGVSIQNRAFCSGLGFQLKLLFNIRTNTLQNTWLFGVLWSLLNPQNIKSPFCQEFYRAKRAYIAIIA